MKPTQQEIQENIVAILTEMTKDWGLDLDEISLDTKLSENLCFSSVDMLHLLSSIDMRFKRKLRYEALLVRDGQYVNDLNLQQVVSYVYDNFDNSVENSEPVAM